MNDQLIMPGNIKDLKEAFPKIKIYILIFNYLAQNIGVKITNRVKISNLPNNIAKARTPLDNELILA